MSAVKTYSIQINSSEGEIVTGETGNATYFSGHLNWHPITAVTVSITVVSIEGLQSDPTMTVFTLCKYVINCLYHYVQGYWF